MSFCQILTPTQKALQINVDDKIYGTFAEIGAGQEVARHFFQAGGAAGTVAKTMSAYDMTFSDIIYGKGERYVSEERLNKMLEREYELLTERLGKVRPDGTKFFTYSNTVAAKSYSGLGECHGWMGVRFQNEADSKFSQIVLHVRMMDRENIQQQEAIGKLGVNMIHGCFNSLSDRSEFIKGLMDGLSKDRIIIDMIRVEGPAFAKSFDSRLLNLELVKRGLCHAIMFDENGKILQSTDTIYKKNILLNRGSFRPPTLVNLDMLKCGLENFKASLPKDQKDNIMVLPEISMSRLLARDGDVDNEDFLCRVDLLNALGHKVLITNFENHYQVSEFISTYNKAHEIGIVTGIYNLKLILDEEQHKDKSTGLMGSLGELFGHHAKLFIYPAADDNEPNKLIKSNDVKFPKNIKNLILYLRDNNLLNDIDDFNPEFSGIWSRTVIKMIQEGEPGWEKMVPKIVSKTVKDKNLFGAKK
ncbi:MAG: hypothetical protein KC493_05050 [Bacteriovoracaceae bacterium]|nr:hypothetical protein [Bacteriovoracaceae bacterium]